MLPLILEPKRWERSALLELAEMQHEGLRTVLGAFRGGYAFTFNPGVMAREPVRLEAAVDLP
jgi:hypothetical protein